jgi:hypothetical protein
MQGVLSKLISALTHKTIFSKKRNARPGGIITRNSIHTIYLLNYYIFLSIISDHLYHLCDMYYDHTENIYHIVY